MRLNSRACCVFFFLLLQLALVERTIGQDAAEVVLRDCVVATLDDAQPEARAIALRGGKIVEVAVDGKLSTPVDSNTKVLSLNGAFVMPGFVEGHAHFMNLGLSRLNLELADCADWQSVVAQVAEAAKKVEPGEWIVGRGWHQEKWTATPAENVEGYPVHKLLSEAAPNNPVLLTHASGHLGIANAAALKIAGIDSDSDSPRGGELLFDTSGQPTGILRETAQSLVSRHYRKYLDEQSPRKKRERRLAALKLATDECVRNGITTFHDAGISFKDIDELRALEAAGELTVRMYVMVRDTNAAMEARLAEYRTPDDYDGLVTVRAIKRMVDGALGAHGAWLLEAYSDQPDKYGLNLDSLDSLRQTALLAARHNYQLCIHAIGDRANQEVLNIYDQIQRQNRAARNMRWRIEHAQHLDPVDIPRFAELGVIASMQAVHCTSDAPFVVTRLGTKRARYGAYAWRSLTDAGAVVVNGTDAPVESVSPVASFYSTVTRRSRDGKEFFPEQKLTRREALATYTHNSAYAAFREDRSGRIRAGYDADIVVLSHDLRTCPEEQIPATKVLHTIVNGNVVYSAKAN